MGFVEEKCRITLRCIKQFWSLEGNMLFVTVNLSLWRKALFSLQAENGDLKHQLTEGPKPDGKQNDEQKVLDSEEEDEEEELDVTIEEVEDEEEEESSELWDAWDGELTLSQTNIQTSDEQRKKTANRPESLNLLANSSQVGGSWLYKGKTLHENKASHFISFFSCLLSRTLSCQPVSSRAPHPQWWVRRQFVCSRRAKSWRRDWWCLKPQCRLRPSSSKTTGSCSVSGQTDDLWSVTYCVYSVWMYLHLFGKISKTNTSIIKENKTTPLNCSEVHEEKRTAADTLE